MTHKELLYKILDMRTEVLKKELANICRDTHPEESVSITGQIAELAIIKTLFEILSIAEKAGGFSDSLIDLLDELDYTETFFDSLGDPKLFIEFSDMGIGVPELHIIEEDNEPHYRKLEKKRK